MASTPVWAIECGDVLGLGGTYVLTADLSCEESLPVGLTLTDGASLDLQGHRLTTSIAVELAVQLLGHGTTLRGGEIHGGNFVVVEVSGTGKHLLQDLIIRGGSGQTGVEVHSDGNVLRQLYASLGAASGGIIVLGHRNWLRAVTVEFTDLGIDLDGTSNVLLQSQMLSCDTCIDVRGDANVIAHNEIVEGSFQLGIAVSGEGNWIVRNTAHVADFDAIDAHGDCTHNHWIANDLTTADPACLLEPPHTLGNEVALQ